MRPHIVQVVNTLQSSVQCAESRSGAPLCGARAAVTEDISNTCSPGLCCVAVCCSVLSWSFFFSPYHTHTLPFSFQLSLYLSLFILALLILSVIEGTTNTCSLGLFFPCPLSIKEPIERIINIIFPIFVFCPFFSFPPISTSFAALSKKK